MIVGTAGHIDHGKTTLVRALTGVDTDRLKEEKARGISIELGYAYAALAGDTVIGFIDVPGHERFVHTMLAGASGIDFALLVVAADDGVMPQTREHVAILDLLGVARGAVALTKADRATPDRLAAVTADVAALLAPTALAAAPTVATRATDPLDPGVAALGALLAGAAAKQPARAAGGLFRLAVDRSFALPGRGTIVTGTVFGGRATAGEDLVVLPAGRRVRVRGIHSQNRAAEAGQAGERCALNLTGIEPGDIARGDWVADARAMGVTSRIDARLRLLEAEAPLVGYPPVHVHFGATHVTGHALPLEGPTLAPGRPGFVQLVLDRPVAAAPGDRFIIRNAQGARTLGGGVLLDPGAPSRRRRTEARRRLLQARERLLASGDFGPLLQAVPWGLSARELELACAMPLASLVRPPGALSIRLARDEAAVQWVDAAHWQAQGEHLLGALGQFHAT
ncbi:MAG: selenocysteine-specific translation elongation factor, partial [Proteobacteria bacterium]|nr:selenocysteine-specific translation elongation factor [Pseudomonadota bacterium]